MNDRTKATEIIRILIVNDHTVVRDGLRALISVETGMEVIAEAADAVEAVKQARRFHPHVILLDLSIPSKDEVALIREIMAEVPESRILVLTNHSEDEKVFPVIKAGVQGYLLKECSSQDMLQAIRQIHHGKSFLHPTIANKLIREFSESNGQGRTSRPAQDALSEREQEVLGMIAHGLSNHQIAQRLSLSDRTIHVHVRKIFEKLHVVNRTQAALHAVREGLISMPMQKPSELF